MKKEEILALFAEYEQAACEVNQVECWSAKNIDDIMPTRYAWFITIIFVLLVL